MSGVTGTKPGPAIGRATARPPLHVPTPPRQRVSSAPSQRAFAPPSERLSAPPSERLSAGPSERATAGPSGRATVRPSERAAAGMAQRRAELESRWRARLERVTELSLAYHDAAQHVRDGAPSSRLGAGRRTELLARRTVAERQALADIEAALDRLSNGQYGRCEQCRQPISAALLARQPQARHCSACACLALQDAW
jgi:DnaK suppressor protein